MNKNRNGKLIDSQSLKFSLHVTFLMKNDLLYQNKWINQQQRPGIQKLEMQQKRLKEGPQDNCYALDIKNNQSIVEQIKTW